MTNNQIIISDDMDHLLEVLPEAIMKNLNSSGEEIKDLLEIVMDLGRIPEARFPDKFIFLGRDQITKDDILHVTSRISAFGKDNRSGIERTLHRISAIKNRTGDIVGLTLRVGRAVYGTIDIINDMIKEGKSILLLGRPGVGKTTLLRESARVLSDELLKRVIIVDTSNEIAGDGDIPHPGIGNSRRMQVIEPSCQHSVMIEAVENHMPEVIIIDEIGNVEETYAARTIAERGVQLIATAHGNTLENLINNPTLIDLIGGITSVTLGDEEAKKRGTQKTVLERKAPATFDCIIEIQDKDTLAIHDNVMDVIDLMLRGIKPAPEIRIRKEGSVEVVQKTNLHELSKKENNKNRFDIKPKQVKVFLLAVSKSRFERAAEYLNLPVKLVKYWDQADMIITLKSFEKREAKRIKYFAERVSVYSLKDNSPKQINDFLKDYFQVDYNE